MAGPKGLSMEKGAPSLPPADPVRILAAIEQLSQLSEPGRGVSRLAYTKLERQAHDLFAA